MAEDELVETLKNMCVGVPWARRRAVVCLFGVKNARYLKDQYWYLHRIGLRATGASTYGDLIRPGMQLAEKVVPKEDVRETLEQLLKE